MSANINCVLTPCNIATTNVVQNSTPVATSAGNPSAGATTIQYDGYSQIPTSPTVIQLPATTVYVVWIRNLGGTNSLNVTLTPAGGSAWSSPAVVLPGGVFIYWLPYTTAPGSGGFTTVSLQAVGGSTPAEIFLAS
jgi:hypothetical protein